MMNTGSNILLLGSHSCGKSSMVNALSLQLCAFADSKAIKKGRDITWVFNKSPASGEYMINSDFEQLKITDTSGIEYGYALADKHMDTLNNFMFTDADTPKIIMYLVDTTNTCFDDAMYKNLSYVDAQICEQKKSGSFVDLFVVFNKCDNKAHAIDIDEIVNNIQENGVDCKILKLSCHANFFDAVKEKGINVKIDKSCNKKDLEHMIRKSKYTYTKSLKKMIDTENVLVSKLLKYRVYTNINGDDNGDDSNNDSSDDDGDDEDEKLDDIFEKVQNSIDESAKKRVESLLDHIDNKFDEYTITAIANRSNDEKIIPLLRSKIEDDIVTACEKVMRINICIDNFIDRLSANIKKCIDNYLSSTSSNTNSNTNSDTNSDINMRANKLRFPLFCKLSRMDNEDESVNAMVHTYLMYNISHIDYDTLYENYIDRVVNLNNADTIEIDVLCSALSTELLQFDKFYVARELYNYEIPRSLKQFIKLCSIPVKNLVIMDELDVIDKKVLSKYMGDQSYVKFKYLLHSCEKNSQGFGNIMRLISSDKREVLNEFLEEYNGMMSCDAPNYPTAVCESYEDSAISDIPQLACTSTSSDNSNHTSKSSDNDATMIKNKKLKVKGNKKKRHMHDSHMVGK